jgi:hypothetical protein
MYWFTPTILTVLLVSLVFAITALATSYTYPLTITLTVILVVGVVLGIYELSKKKTKRSFHMPTSSSPIAKPTFPIPWPKNL